MDLRMRQEQPATLGTWVKVALQELITGTQKVVLTVQSVNGMTTQTARLAPHAP